MRSSLTGGRIARVIFAFDEQTIVLLNGFITGKKHHSSSLEAFLAEDGLLEEASVAATKKVIAAQIADAMKK